MSNNVPVAKPIAWISIVPHVALLALLHWLFSHLTGPPSSIYYAVGTYFLLSFGLRFFLTKHQRKGMTLVKSNYFADAIPHFQRSVDFFTQHAWVDKYRYITLLASSKMSYREMGLCNIAFCYSQIGAGLKARALYEEIHAEYPNNGIAISALNMFKSM